MLLTTMLANRTDCVTFSYGPGLLIVWNWRELWVAVFRVLAFAMRIDQHGACTCGCKVRECDYCAHECAVDIAG